MVLDDVNPMEGFRTAVVERDEAMKTAAAYRLLLINIVKPGTIPEFESAVAVARQLIEDECRMDGKRLEDFGTITPGAIQDIVKFLKE